MLVGQKITVLGAGVAGLTAALALARRGAQVTVLEQAEALREVGAGLQISPNGSRVLQALGLGAPLADCAMRSRGMQVRNGTNGRALFRLDHSRADPPYYYVHRADLIAMLGAAARAAGVQIRLLQKIADVAITDDHVSLCTEQGARYGADILVAADGLHSRARLALGGAPEPRFTGQVAWRAVVAGQDGDGDFTQAMAQLFVGARRHVVVYPLRGGRDLNIVAVEERRDWLGESWSQQGDVDQMRARFAGMVPALDRLLQRVEQVHEWGLFRHPVAQSWVRGHVVLVGDAAHPTLPFMAQGANMALEDAWVLADQLAADGGGDIAGALLRYQALRKPRCQRIVAASARNARHFHLPPGPVRFAAHTGLRLAGTLAPALLAQRFNWLYGHDVTTA